MATETFSITYDAGENLFLGIFRLSDGHVFDFDDNTFKALSGADTPYVAAAEQTDPGGTGKSSYVASVDLGDINATSDPLDVVLDWFTDDTLATRVSESNQISIVGSQIDNGLELYKPLVTVGIDDDMTAKVVGHLTINEQNVMLASGSMSVVIFEVSTPLDTISVSSSTVVRGYFFVATHALSGLVAGKVYGFEVTITDADGSEYKRTEFCAVH